jgi:hypothetical protein
MCSCKRHHQANATCTCLCDHPRDSLILQAQKRFKRRLFPLAYEVQKRREKALMWVAWKCPRTLAYWITIRVAVENSPDYPAEQPVGEVLEKWRVKTG